MADKTKAVDYSFSSGRQTSSMAEGQEKLFLARKIIPYEGGVTVVPRDEDTHSAVHTRTKRTEGVPEIVPSDDITPAVAGRKSDDYPSCRTKQTLNWVKPRLTTTRHEHEESFQSIASKRNQTQNQLQEKKGVQCGEVFKLTKNEKEAINWLENLPKAGKFACFLPDAICQPDQQSYLENVHFSVIRLLGKGHANNTTLCVDKKTHKLFVKKQLCYERDFMMSLSDDTQAYVSEAFTSMSTYLNDLLNIDNPYFEGMIETEHWNKNECRIPLHHKHKNFTRVYGFKQNNTKVGIFLEFSGIPLCTFTQRNFPLADDDAWTLIYQGFSALEYLHMHGIIHFDIKPANICVSRCPNGLLLLKLIDFGSAKLSYQHLFALESLGWTPEYMAPESCRYVLQQEKIRNFNTTARDITMKVDVFSFGLTIVFMTSQRHALLSIIDTQKNGGLSKDERQQLLWKMAVEEEQSLKKVFNNIQCNQELRALVEKLCCNSEKRISAQEALKIVEERQAGILLDETHGNTTDAEGVKERGDIGGKKRRLSNHAKKPIGMTLEDNLCALTAQVPWNNLRRAASPPINNETQKKLRDKILRKRKLEETNVASVTADDMDSERQAGILLDETHGNTTDAEGVKERGDTGGKKRRLSNHAKKPIGMTLEDNLCALTAQVPWNNLRRAALPPINNETQKKLRDKILRKRKLEETNVASVTADDMDSESSNRERETRAMELSARRTLPVEEEERGNFQHKNIPDLHNLI